MLIQTTWNTEMKSYLGIGEKEETQFFYYFVESESNPEQDPIILYLTGCPGSSTIHPLFHQLGIDFYFRFHCLKDVMFMDWQNVLQHFYFLVGPLSFKFGDAFEDTTLILNPNSWTKVHIFIHPIIFTNLQIQSYNIVLFRNDIIKTISCLFFCRWLYHILWSACWHWILICHNKRSII